MSPAATSGATAELDLPLVVTQLMKGVLYRDTHEKAWRDLLQLQAQARDYVAQIGLTITIDEAEGYAFSERPLLRAMAATPLVAWLKRSLLRMRLLGARDQEKACSTLSEWRRSRC